MALAPEIVAAIKDELDSASHGQRTATAQRLADLYGVSRTTIYRAAQRAGTKRPRAKNSNHQNWAATATAIAHRSPNSPTSLDIAIDAGIATGELPAEAAAVPLSTLYRVRRELGLNRNDSRTQRMNADYPMQCLQIDGSTSAHLSVTHQLPDGDWALKMYRRPTPAGGYKNKPLGAERMRLVVYGVWDMCTGYTLSRYCAAKGESSLDALDFLLYSMAPKTDPRIVMRGVPDDLSSDQGPLFKSRAAGDLLDRLDINLATGKPYAKTRQGGIERSWRTIWQRFERSLFLRGEDTITLTELNARLVEFQIKENALRRSRTPVAGRAVSRADAWVALTNARPADNRLREVPANALATLAQTAPRRADANGVVRWQGEEYEVPGLHNEWLTIRQSITDRNIIIAESATGQRVDARPLKRRPYGEIKGTPATPLAKLLSDAPDSSSETGVDIFAPGAADIAASNVSAMPARIASAQPLEDPLDAARLRTIDEALALFYSLYPAPLSAEHRALVIDHIESHSLEREAVIELAAELSAAAHHVPQISE